MEVNFCFSNERMSMKGTYPLSIIKIEKKKAQKFLTLGLSIRGGHLELEDFWPFPLLTLSVPSGHLQDKNFKLD